MFVGGFRTIYGRWIERGGLYRWQFAELISEDAWALALSDAVLVGTTVLCVPFAKVSAFDAAYLYSFSERSVSTGHRSRLGPLLLDRPNFPAHRANGISVYCHSLDFPSVSVSTPLEIDSGKLS